MGRLARIVIRENEANRQAGITGRSDRTKFRNQVLGPILPEKLFKITIPSKPRNREAGADWWKRGKTQ